MKKRKVDILGTKYTLVERANESKYPKLQGSDGYVDYSIHEMVVADFGDSPDGIKDLESYRRKVTRHEIIHAFFHESGLDCHSDFARNEALVDWIALQFPKMAKVFKEVGVSE